MQRSEELNELAAALCAAQAEIDDAEKVKTNPAFRSRYADLGAVWDAAKPALTKHGLSIAQFAEPSEAGQLAMTTMLLHKSGQFIAGTQTMPLQKQDPQGYGSATTYARRYGLAAMLGICPEDDDGNGAIRHDRQTYREAATPAAQPVPANPRRESTATAAAKYMEANGLPPHPGSAPINDVYEGSGQCPRCHAPGGKRHGKPCLDDILKARERELSAA